MNLPGVMLLAAATPRSQAYAQALRRRGFRLETAVIFEKPGQPMPGQGRARAESPVTHGALFLPDLSIPLVDSCVALANTTLTVSAGSVNDGVIRDALQTHAPSLVIYSGFGGQIVSAELLGLGPRFLHLHSGWLPDYRGSTTVYYSLLREGRCGVSAILLRPEIDVGEIVLRRWFPAPPPRLDIDYAYDSAIRADVLVSAMELWAEAAAFDHPIAQSPSEGETYYVIHPVLKHLAIMGLTMPHAARA